MLKRRADVSLLRGRVYQTASVVMTSGYGTFAVERFFGPLKCEHLLRGCIGDCDALDMDVRDFCIICDAI